MFGRQQGKRTCDARPAALEGNPRWGPGQPRGQQRHGGWLVGGAMDDDVQLGFGLCVAEWGFEWAVSEIQFQSIASLGTLPGTHGAQVRCLCSTNMLLALVARCSLTRIWRSPTPRFAPRALG